MKTPVSGGLPLEILLQALNQTPAGMVVLDRPGRVVFVNPSFERLVGRPSAEVLGRRALEAVHPEDVDALQARLANPGDPGSRTPARWLTPDGGVLDSECVVMRASSAGEDYTVLAALDLTPARKLAYRTQTLARFASALALAPNMDEALQVLARSVVETTAALACAVVALERPTPAGQGVPSIRTLGTANLPEDWSHRVEALWGTGEPLPPRQALATGRTVVGEPPESMREFTEALGADALTCVPMRSKGLVVGLLSCLYRNLQDLDQAELAFLETVAPLAAVVVDNARLYQEVREQVSLQERQHLARELHDSVSQALYGIGLGARTARTLLEQDPARAASALDYVLALAESGLAEMRALLFELRPESLERGGLVAALEARARAAGSLVVELDLPAEPDLTLEARHGLLRIASEAIHNVVKHARASRLGLSLKLEAGCAALEVCDDGQGFAVGQEAPGHMGLSTMRERAEALGGTLRVESRPGQGTRVVARVPQVPSCAPTLVGVRSGPAPDAGIPGRG